MAGETLSFAEMMWSFAITGGIILLWVIFKDAGRGR